MDPLAAGRSTLMDSLAAGRNGQLQSRRSPVTTCLYLMKIRNRTRAYASLTLHGGIHDPNRR